MDELDRLLADAMHDAASRAPSDAGLLGTVRDRSRRYRRRRAALGAAAGAALLAAGIPFVVVLAAGPDSSAPPLGPIPSYSPYLSPSSPPSFPPSSSPSFSPSSSPPSSPSATSASVKLVAGFTAPAFPYALPADDGLRAPVASMVDGGLIALFEATEQQHHADITVTVSPQRPAFAGKASETPVRVRDHAGTLRTIDVQPTSQYTLYWQESAGRWIRLATDDTYTPQQVVALAESLSPASVPVLPPFKLDLAPAGLAVDTVTASTMSFRGAAGTFKTVLRKRHRLAATNETVGSYHALLTHDSGRATLDVDVTDWDATLEITVGAGLTMTDADLLRYAAGVHILNRSDPE